MHWVLNMQIGKGEKTVTCNRSYKVVLLSYNGFILKIKIWHNGVVLMWMTSVVLKEAKGHHAHHRSPWWATLSQHHWRWQSLAGKATKTHLWIALHLQTTVWYSHLRSSTCLSWEKQSNLCEILLSTDWLSFPRIPCWICSIMNSLRLVLS